MARHYCGTCAYCGAPAIYNGNQTDGPTVQLCATHYARMRRGIPLDTPIRRQMDMSDPFGRLREAALHLADAETDTDEKNAARRLGVAAEVYVQALAEERARQSARRLDLALSKCHRSAVKWLADRGYDARTYRAGDAEGVELEHRDEVAA